MTPDTPFSVIERVFVSEHGRVLATLIGAFDDFDVAETALQEALAVALEEPAQTTTPIRGRAPPSP